MTLCEEEMQRVLIARHDAQVLGRGVEVDAGHELLVFTPQVDGELAVDEYSQIVVTAEGEHLAADIAEAGHQLEGEVEVVVAPFVAEKLVVDWKECVI